MSRNNLLEEIRQVISVSTLKSLHKAFSQIGVIKTFTLTFTLQPNMSSACDNPSDAAEIKPAEEQDVCSARVRFSKDQEDHLYSNFGLKRPKTLRDEEEEEGEKEEEDDVEYTVLHFKSTKVSSE